MIIKYLREKKKIILITLLGFLVYLPSFFVPFLWDDTSIITDNPFIKQIRYLPQIFSSGIFAGELHSKNFYRPIQALSNMLDYYLWQGSSIGYHFTNILLQIVCALLLYYLFRLLFKKELVAFLSSGLFLVHPVNVETVCYVSGRADSLALLFMLLSFISYINFRQNLLKRFFVYSVLFFTLGVFSKEIAISAIFIYPLLDYVLDNNKEYKYYFVFVLIAFFFLFIRFLVLGSSLPKSEFSIFPRVLTFIVSISDYIKLLVWPVDLHMSYTSRVFTYINGLFLLKFTFVILFFLLLYLIFKREKKMVLFSFAWFIIFLIPHSNILPINAYFADHFVYLSQYALFFLCLSAVYEFFEHRARIIFYLIYIIVIFSLSLCTISYTEIWLDPVKLYRRIISLSANSFVAHNNLGAELDNRGLGEDARKQYLLALSINPGYALAYNNLGKSFMKEGQTLKAIAIFKQAIEKEPQQPVLHFNLARAYELRGDKADSQVEYEKALNLAKGIAPWDSSIYFRLGLLYYRSGKFDMAIEEFEKAIDLNPEDPAAHVNLGLSFKAQGKFQAAFDEYKKALNLDPKFVQAYNNLGVIYALAKDYESALDYFSRALRLDEKFDEARFNSGLLYLERGDFEQGKKELNLISKNASYYPLAQEELKKYKLKPR